MNGLSLRINRTGGSKSKNSIGFTPVDIPTSFIENTEYNEILKSFMKSTTTDDQLVIIKRLLLAKQDGVINVVVFIFWRAEAKHPVKCFIARYITKSVEIQQPFTEALSSLISQQIAVSTTDYKQYIPVVSKVATCIENFPAGVAAMRVVDLDLARYLGDCLNCCVRTLRGTTLSPTEKNELFNLAHLTLRLILHIVQKAHAENISKLIHMFDEIRLYIQELLFDDDAPMDTKTVCGILYLSMYITEYGLESWTDVLNPSNSKNSLKHLLKNEAAELALYSAIPTVVSAEKLQSQCIDDAPAIEGLTNKILDIGERSSSESTFILGVTRTLLQICKHLDKTSDVSMGINLVDSILSFVWSHLEHYMDSVRHLTAQMLGCVVKYCARLKKEGNDEAINKLFKALSTLNRSRKSYYLSVTCLTTELGASCVMMLSPDLIVNLLEALGSQPVQASATTALEILLQKHATECNTETIHSTWVQPILQHVASNSLESGTLNILESLLVRAFKLHEQIVTYILPFIKQSSSPDKPRDLKCILMLLSVVRKSGVTSKLSGEENEDEWRGIISYEVLRQAAIDSGVETRILSVSLVVECPKSTEPFASGELSLVLHFLLHNINAQAPSFRQLSLSLMKKFIKRFEDSYKVIKRQKGPSDINNKVDYYLQFVDDLRDLCFNSLIQGANYSRRRMALQILVWSDQLHLDGYNRKWTEDYIEKLLLHLEDSYENNKAFALQVLRRCPEQLLKGKKYSISIDLKDIFRQASSLKPTDCVSAAYQLELVTKKLPDDILQGKLCDTKEPVTYTLLHKLLEQLKSELATCKRSVVSAARQAPMYGILHCMGHFVTLLDSEEISSDANWTVLIADVISTCMEVNAAVACVVNNSSPEGHLPMDMSGVSVTDDGNSDGLRLDDGRLVTAQMVLLCAWRSVKEVSLLLGSVASRLTITGESTVGTLTIDQMMAMGQHFTSLLSETKHRGAFEQAYVGFTCLLSRLWRCRTRQLHALPRAWLAGLMTAISTGDRSGTLCATRRSAGLPFMIQALVTTELEVQGNPRGFHECMTGLMALATLQPPGVQPPATDESRVHALNILRALFRNSALEETVAGYVGDGLVVALNGFEGGTWAERNSSTLLFSALMVRIFGVQRSKADTLNVRNKMTGRIFFLRYPQLYDYMLDKMQEVSKREDNVQMLRPSLYPILLLLARLYPSSLEGTVSNLKLVAFIPHVLSCASSAVLKSRQLAAKAIVPLVSPELYLSHVQSMFQLLNNQSTSRNYCHGILLQLIRLLEAKTGLDNSLTESVKGTLWLLELGVSEKPCYLIVDDYVKVLNLLIWRLPSLLEESTIKSIINHLDTIIFTAKPPKITSGREICLANCTYLYFIFLNQNNMKTYELINRALRHSSYEVVLSALNYLLILYNNLETENHLQEHIKSIDKTMLEQIRNDEQITGLLHKNLENKHLECKQKSLKILTLQDKCRKYNLDEEKLNEIVRQKLSEYVSNDYDNMTHIYLERLLDFVSNVINNSGVYSSVMLEMIRVALECSWSDNSEHTRAVVVGFLEKNSEKLMSLELNDLEEKERFEFKATTWAAIITLLEDDDETHRQRVADSLLALLRCPTRVIPSVCGTMVRGHLAGLAEGPVLLCLIALLDFKSVVCMYDDVGEEARVFDQNERYNLHLEETVWTDACADQIIKTHQKPIEFVINVINNSVYSSTFDNLCGSNVKVFQKMVQQHIVIRNDALNPKIEIFVNRLRL